MFEVERVQIRILSNWADAQGMHDVRDLLRRAESAVKAHAELRTAIPAERCSGRVIGHVSEALLKAEFE